MHTWSTKSVNNITFDNTHLLQLNLMTNQDPTLQLSFAMIG